MLPDRIREAHPYFMHEEVLKQAEAVRRAAELGAEPLEELAPRLRSGRRVLLTGCGTSFYAAWAGEWILRLAAGIETRAIQAFELAHYDPALNASDLVIGVSQSGEKALTLDALRQARERGAATALITGAPAASGGRLVDLVIPNGCDWAYSWAHTVSYLTAVAIYAELARRLTSGSVPDTEALANAVAGALRTEDQVRQIAQDWQPYTHFLIVGGGPNEPAAHEAALKVMETNYRAAQGIEMEQVLHGALASVTERSAVIVCAPAGASRDRAVDVATAVGHLGAPLLVIADEGDSTFDDRAQHVVAVPPLPEAVSGLVQVVPSQLLSYYLAVADGVNPDLLHRHDERYLKARFSYRM